MKKRYHRRDGRHIELYVVAQTNQHFTLVRCKLQPPSGIRLIKAASSNRRSGKGLQKNPGSSLLYRLRHRVKTTIEKSGD